MDAKDFQMENQIVVRVSIHAPVMDAKHHKLLLVKLLLFQSTRP